MESTRLTTLINDRKNKLEALHKLKINPYPAKASRSHIISKAREELGKEVCVVGRIIASRGHGKIVFYDLKDESGKIQLLLKQDTLGEKYHLTKLLDIGDFLQASGEVIKTASGEVTVDAANFKLLTKSLRPLPDKWHGLTDVEERFRQRYIDLLLNPKIKEIFKVRAKIVRLLREYLDKKGFLEVKTPALQPIYGGATAKPFITHHNTLDIDLYLRIADELYLKRLIVGGFEKVYEICTDFRNEGIDRWHNPEFSQLEFYQAYATYEDLMKTTEEMLSWIVKEINGSLKIVYGEKTIDFSKPWKRLTLRDAIHKQTGVDIEKEKTKGALTKVLKEKGIKIDSKKALDVPTIIDELYKTMVRPNIIDPTFLVDYPYFMRPLAKRKESNTSKVENFQLVVAGAELINAYSELNDPAEQKARWEEDIKRGKVGVEEFQVLDEDYIRALEYGMPPTAGWGMGIERLTAILTNSHSLKEVILFPTLRPKTENEKSKIKEKYDYRKKKIVAIINQDLEQGLAFNALGHLAFSSGHYSDSDWMGQEKIADASGMIHRGISKYPFIVLKATKEEITNIIAKARENGIDVSDYPQEMFETGHDEDLVKAVGKAKEQEIVYHAVVLKGESAAVNDLTKGLTLYK